MTEVDYRFYLKRAKDYLKRRDYKNFLENISVARYLVEGDIASKRDVLFTYANGLYEFTDYPAALEVVNELIPHFSDDKKYALLVARGVILGKLGRWDEAIYILEEQIKLDEFPLIKIKAINSLAWAYIYQSKIQSNRGFLDLAIDICKDGKKLFNKIDDNESRKKLLMNLGIAYWYKGKFEKTLKMCTEALSYVNNDPKVLNNMAYAYIMLNDLEEANRYLNLAEEMAENNFNYFEKAHTYFIRGQMAEREGDYIKAIDFYLIAENDFNLAQAFLESSDCSVKVDYLMSKIKREMNLIKRNNIMFQFTPQPEVEEVLCS